jgi:hypothetical protein
MDRRKSAEDDKDYTERHHRQTDLYGLRVVFSDLPVVRLGR